MRELARPDEQEHYTTEIIQQLHAQLLRIRALSGGISAGSLARRLGGLFSAIASFVARLPVSFAILRNGLDSDAFSIPVADVLALAALSQGQEMEQEQKGGKTAVTVTPSPRRLSWPDLHRVRYVAWLIDSWMMANYVLSDERLVPCWIPLRCREQAPACSSDADLTTTTTTTTESQRLQALLAWLHEQVRLTSDAASPDPSHAHAAPSHMLPSSISVESSPSLVGLGGAAIPPLPMDAPTVHMSEIKQFLSSLATDVSADDVVDVMAVGHTVAAATAGIASACLISLLFYQNSPDPFLSKSQLERCTALLQASLRGGNELVGLKKDIQEMIRQVDAVSSWVAPPETGVMALQAESAVSLGQHLHLVHHQHHRSRCRSYPDDIVRSLLFLSNHITSFPEALLDASPIGRQLLGMLSVRPRMILSQEHGRLSASTSSVFFPAHLQDAARQLFGLFHRVLRLNPAASSGEMHSLVAETFKWFDDCIRQQRTRDELQDLCGALVNCCQNVADAAGRPPATCAFLIFCSDLFTGCLLGLESSLETPLGVPPLAMLEENDGGDNGNVNDRWADADADAAVGEQRDHLRLRWKDHRKPFLVELSKFTYATAQKAPADWRTGANRASIVLLHCNSLVELLCDVPHVLQGIYLRLAVAYSVIPNRSLNTLGYLARAAQVRLQTLLGSGAASLMMEDPYMVFLATRAFHVLVSLKRFDAALAAVQFCGLNLSSYSSSSLVASKLSFSSDPEASSVFRYDVRVFEAFFDWNVLEFLAHQAQQAAGISGLAVSSAAELRVDPAARENHFAALAVLRRLLSSPVLANFGVSDSRRRRRHDACLLAFWDFMVQAFVIERAGSAAEVDLS